MNTKNKKYLIWSLMSLLISTFLSLPIFATNIQIEGYVSGGLTVTPHGNWSNTLLHNSVSYNLSSNKTATWTSTPTEDYLTFIDDTSIPGFHIEMSITDFIYSGNSTTQEPLDSSNFTMYAPYNQNEPIGYDDPSYIISISPNSCANITPTNFIPNTNLLDPNKNYSLSLSNTAKTVIASDADCLNIGQIRFDKTEILIPAGSSIGNYTATITTTIIDGTP